MLLRLDEELWLLLLRLDDEELWLPPERLDDEELWLPPPLLPPPRWA